MAAIGIDLGSNKSVLAATKRRGIDIVLNGESNRSTPTLVAYTTAERLIGDAVKTQVKRNFKNSILYLTRFLGLNATCKEQLAQEMLFCPQKLIEFSNNKIGFEVVQDGQKLQLTVEQILAFYIQKLKVFYEKAEIPDKDMVISIPSYASNTERQAILDACDIAEVNCLRVISESTAITYNYGFFRQKDLSKDKKRTVAFVDFGHSKCTITIASFLQGEAQILVHNSDRNLGGRNFDLEIVNVIGKEFADKYGDDPLKAPRCRLRMFEAAEKARKMLSSDTESNINIDYLLNEEDLNRKLGREEFEKMIDPHVRRFAALITETLQKASKFTFYL